MPVKVLWEIILQASVELMKYVCTKDAKTPKCKLFFSFRWTIFKLNKVEVYSKSFLGEKNAFKTVCER